MKSSALTGSRLSVRDAASPDPRLSLPRLHLLRFGYLFMGVGLAVTRWPKLLSHDPSWPLMDGVVTSMLVALSLLFFLGVRYPVQMIPILLFEMVWKVIWLSTVAFPLWIAGRLDEATSSVVFTCSLVVIVLVILPWRFVLMQYVTKPGDRWLPGPGRPADNRI